jgi:hypothetical protein
MVCSRRESERKTATEEQDGCDDCEHNATGRVRRGQVVSDRRHAH